MSSKSLQKENPSTRLEPAGLSVRQALESNKSAIVLETLNRGETIRAEGFKS